MPDPASPKPSQTITYHAFSSNNVRDMAWLLFSPAVFEDALGRYPAFNLQLDHTAVIRWLHEHDQHHALGTSNMPLRSDFRRLGLYCEALLHYFFQESQEHALCPFKLRAHNLQIFKDGNTLGELDLLLEDTQATFFHVELAVKFYLAETSGESQWSNWIGPNSIDRLDIKCERMADHQLSLINKQPKEFFEAIAHTKNHVNANTHEPLDAQHPISAAHLFKGMNFVHFTSIEKAVGPSHSNIHNPMGAWGRLSELKNESSTLEKHFPIERSYLVDKMGWMTGDANILEKKSLNALLNDVEALFNKATEKGYPTPGTMIFFDEIENAPSLELKKAPFERPRENRIIVVGDSWPSKS